MKVRDLMTTNAATVHSNEPLSAAAKLMWDCDCGSIPVKDATSERIIGMITDRDICMAAWSKDRAPSSINISDAISWELFACAAEDSLASAQKLMCDKQIRRIPVLDGAKKLVGVLSLADIVNYSGKAGATGTNELEPTKVVGTLSDICKPRSSQQSQWI